MFRSSSTPSVPRDTRRTGLLAGLSVGAVAVGVSLLMTVGSTPAYAAQPPVGLGTTASFAVLAGTTVTNTGPTVVTGDVGVNPGTAITGFPPGQVLVGTQHAADAVALQAQNDLVTAYDDAAGRTPATTVSSDLGGQTLAPGVYRTAAAMALTGTVTLDAAGDPDAVFIFQAGSSLITASSSTVALLNGADPCNVFWQVGSSVTLGTSTTFVGNILALTSASLENQATVVGRVLARNGEVSLDANTITRPTCAAAPTSTPSATPTNTPSATATSTPHRTPAATPTLPFGHPETGRPASTAASGTPWLALGILALGGAGGVALVAARRPRRPQPRE